MQICLIAAIARNGVIGDKGKVPWNIPEDVERFKELTSGHSVIIGRKTFETCTQGALPGRRNIVLSKTKKELDGVLVVDNLDKAFALCKDEEKVFVIGGGEVYRQALDFSDKLFLTHVDKEVKGDTYFPEFNKSAWDQISHEFGPDVIYAEYAKRK